MAGVQGCQRLWSGVYMQPGQEERELTVHMEIWYFSIPASIN